MNEYTCAHCKNIYESNLNWDGKKEAKDNFGEDFFERTPQEDLVILCDDCYTDLQNFWGGLDNMKNAIKKEQKHGN